MHESNRWGVSRYAAAIVVCVLHLAMLAAFLMEFQPHRTAPPAVESVQLLTLSPVNLPKVRAEKLRPRRFGISTAITASPPELNAPDPSSSPAPASFGTGAGSGIDWAAEARRALHAFDIRNQQPGVDNLISGKPGEDDWWPQARHNTGEPYKTANGDWIVWISANCYQVASAEPGLSAFAASPPQTVCRRDLRNTAK